MDLKAFYFENINEQDYHFRFYKNIQNVNKIYNVFSGYEEVNDYEFIVYDPEEAMTKFRELCQPDVHFDNEKKCWFYLVTYYLFKLGYEIKEFPRLLARPPINPEDFTYGEIRNRIIAQGGDDNGTVRYAARRTFVAGISFKIHSNHIQIDNDVIEQKFIEISNHQASFANMGIDEKLAELANLIENLLKRNNKFITLDYESVCFEYLDDAKITSYRKKMHCFRHSTEEALLERKSYTEEQKKFFVDYGLTIVKVIYSLLSKNSMH